MSPANSESSARGVAHPRTVTSVSVTPGCAFDPGRLRLPLAFASPAVAVGHDPDSLPSMGHSDVVSTHHERPAGVAFRLQFAEHPVSAASPESRDVFNENPTGSQLAHEPEHFRPQAGALAFDAGALSGD